MTHSSPADIEATLTGPDGTCVILPSFGTAALDNATITVGAAAVGVDSGNDWPEPAPIKPYATTMAAFAGSDPNGNWYLRIGNSASAAGTLADWSLEITNDESIGELE